MCISAALLDTERTRLHHSTFRCQREYNLDSSFEMKVLTRFQSDQSIVEYQDPCQKIDEKRPLLKNNPQSALNYFPRPQDD